MTIKELIAKLNKIKDKNLLVKVCVESGYGHSEEAILIQVTSSKYKPNEILFIGSNE
jgi:hypothetical protein